MAKGSVMRRRARSMRAEPSYLEGNAAKIMKELGIAFSSQVVIGRRYILDFVGKDRPFVLEVDGAHHQESAQQLSDRERDSFCLQAGLIPIRLPYSQVTPKIIGDLVSRIEPESREMIRGRLVLLKMFVKRGAGNTRSNLDRSLLSDCRANKAAATHAA